MTFHVEHAIWCPSCGWFGRKARRRNRAADTASHIRWAAQLACDIRRERAEKVYRETDGGLFAAMVESVEPLTLDQALIIGSGRWLAVVDAGSNVGIEPTSEQLTTWFHP